MREVAVPFTFDATLLALEIDERARALPWGPDPARVFAVRLRPAGVVLVPFWSGRARDLPPWITPPAGAVAIALESGGWAAPLPASGIAGVRPSRHPRRRRVHHTCVVYGDGADVSVLRTGADPPQVLTGAVGSVLDRLVACWARRPEVA